MSEKEREELEYYNLQGGQRYLVMINGEVKAVAPGLRLVDATEEEKRLFKAKDTEKEPYDYGLPV